MTAPKLRTILCEALPLINQDQVLIIHLDEIDRLVLLTKTNKGEFLAALQDLAEFNLVHKDWLPKGKSEKFEKPPAIVFLWTGNMFARNGCSTSLEERNSIYAQLQSALEGKFTAGTRMPSTGTTVILR